MRNNHAREWRERERDLSYAVEDALLEPELVADVVVAVVADVLADEESGVVACLIVSFSSYSQQTQAGLKTAPLSLDDDDGDPARCLFDGGP